MGAGCADLQLQIQPVLLNQKKSKLAAVALNTPSPCDLRLRLRSARTAGLLFAFWESAKKGLCALARQVRTWSARYGFGRHCFLERHYGRAELASVCAIRLCTPRRYYQC